MTVTEILLIVLIVVAAINLIIALTRRSSLDADSRAKLNKIDDGLSRIEPSVREEFSRSRAENQTSFRENREETGNSFKNLGEGLAQSVANLSTAQKNQFELFAIQLKEIRETVEHKLSAIQEDTNKQLDAMRKTVDEKLQESVEKRFNESFKLINERLEAVHKGLGEMQTLAVGVGDLKRALTNVKTRGTFGEVQLGAILEQFLSPEQYVHNEHPDGDRKVVEYAIRLPGKTDGEPLLLPVDSKFPMEDYNRLMDAYESSPEQIEVCGRQFEAAVRSCARDISEKYIKPPKTTDFAILFVPTEGLYAEILRRPGFMEHLQQTYRVSVVGPTNLGAFLTSLQMGFRTLAIEKRSSEVWEILGAVKTEFKKFDDVLKKLKRNLEGGLKNIDEAVGARTNKILGKLRTVHELPQEQAAGIIGEAMIDADDGTETI
jgi:DNA recombination protein RmuC